MTLYISIIFYNSIFIHKNSIKNSLLCNKELQIRIGILPLKIKINSGNDKKK